MLSRRSTRTPANIPTFILRWHHHMTIDPCYDCTIFDPRSICHTPILRLIIACKPLTSFIATSLIFLLLEQHWGAQLWLLCKPWLTNLLFALDLNRTWDQLTQCIWIGRQGRLLGLQSLVVQEVLGSLVLQEFLWVLLVVVVLRERHS
jgi:hypothetical protein